LAEKKARTKAEEADRLKSAFLANMNHEIRTPLNAIVGFSQVIVDEDNAENRKQYLSIIQHNNDLLQQLIADVLDLSKIESNTMAFNYKKTDLPALMGDIYHTTLLRINKEIHLELMPCTPFLFLTDRNRLTQIITNLLNNAIKHTTEGFIRFGYEIKDTEVYFFVKDSGEGIPENKLDTIFGRFVQLDEMNRGVGLGLAICKGLVTQMGGTIGVISKLKEGSTFYFHLPKKQ
jgi:signal transduction histidine kinase